jgi:hypothetical protein
MSDTYDISQILLIIIAINNDEMLILIKLLRIAFYFKVKLKFLIHILDF